MRTQLYSVYDTVACVFNKPFTEHNDESAIRAFKATAADQPHIGDYALYHLGEYDDNNGVITPVTAPTRIISGLDIKAKMSSITPEQQVLDLAKHEALKKQSGI